MEVERYLAPLFADNYLLLPDWWENSVPGRIPRGPEGFSTCDAFTHFPVIQVDVDCVSTVKGSCRRS